MAVRFKVCIDCTDPHLLADFWAEALGYVVEDHSGFIEALLAQGIVTGDHVVDVHGRKGWKTAAAVRDPDAPFDPRTGTGQGQRLLFQVVPEGKTVKNRLHLDLHYGPDRYEAEADRLESLGATRLGTLGTFDENRAKWIVMADPEGNEFCAHG